jgi:heme/copper-type cytochrome/quinol oxidase subunit 2
MRLSRAAGSPTRHPRWGASTGSPTRHPRRRILLVTVLVAAAISTTLGGLLWRRADRTVAAAGLQDSGQKQFAISAHKYAFKPQQLEVKQDDVVTITLQTEDIPHSFTLDGYRIAKRVNPGQTVIFEFRADQAGRFPFYCNLKLDDGCKAMRGELIVRPR